ncbi:MAG: hypothetical protein SGJ07_00920 [Rhodospirillaceae bacterium]|nr:hypothetical protein [Rhodospirillaceae bacterium]
MTRHLARGFALAAFLTAGIAVPALAQETIVLGAAVSETGKYSAEGMHTKNGYDFAVERINGMGLGG